MTGSEVDGAQVHARDISSEPDEIVVLEGVTKTYQQGKISVRALDDITLWVSQGEFSCLCGPSGSGKTTLLNVIAALDTPTAGRVSVCGSDLTRMSENQRASFRLLNLGFIFQSYNLIPVLSARENVEFVMQLQGRPSGERRELARAMLSEVGLGGMENRRPSELSGGQQQRVAVARAIVGRPRLVLADEPTANLDSRTAEGLMELMSSMNEHHGVTFIFSTHDALVMSYARRRIELVDGRVVSDGQVQDNK